MLQLDLADLSSVQKFAGEVNQEGRIDYLILNAGVMACPYGLTKAGFETQMGKVHTAELGQERQLNDRCLSLLFMACSTGLQHSRIQDSVPAGTNVFGHYYLTTLLLEKMKSQVMK